MEQILYMDELNVPLARRTIVMKLPYELRGKWRNTACNLQEHRGGRVIFSNMVNFIEKQVKILSDPLLVLAGIAPASLRRDAATLALARKAQKYDWHILHKATTTPAPPCRLKSRHPYNKAAQEMLQSIPEDLSRDAWLAASWKQTWETAGPSPAFYDTSGTQETG
ncbi:hypothetical protein AAFF_G00281450 [Aldrovandia affinis]|uniref:Uncharacterized protein n=1 Tax=Aldrovandia affinis TaxID=143900 RepID=A0AAD7RAH0_9TELE|nr:hypothetical protein AAFF_G00281450 [Aldrovandia affinis]